MIINSITFLLFFLIIFGLYYLPKITGNIQNVVLLSGSLFFYGWTDWKMLFLLVLSIVIFYMLGNAISKATCVKANWLTCIGVVLGVGLLLYFKYLNFFVQGLADLFETIGLNTNWEAFEVFMPLGISFFTFRLISYVIDIRQRNIQPVSLLDFATYISFFPCILSGPIDRAVSFLPQLKDVRKFDYPLAVEGCRQILWGMFKKMVVADGLSLFVSRDVATSNGATLAIVAVMYSIHIYADFSGYSDMAIGVGKLLGIRVARNFRYPYFSRSVAEFWNRWHMSLLSWFKHYIYFPLGGSRVSRVKAIRNTFIIFLVSGLWHGPNWTFVVWGLFHVVLFLPSLLSKNRKRYKADTPYMWTDLLRCLLVFLMITVSFIIFRSNDMAECLLYLNKVFSPSLFERPVGVMWALPSMVFASIMFIMEWIKRKEEFTLVTLNVNIVFRWILYIFLVLAIVYYQGKPVDFIYFKF